MKKADVEIGGVYVAQISGRIVDVLIDAVNPYGRGWWATNLTTRRIITIKSVSRLWKTREAAELFYGHNDGGAEVKAQIAAGDKPPGRARRVTK